MFFYLFVTYLNEAILNHSLQRREFMLCWNNDIFGKWYFSMITFQILWSRHTYMFLVHHTSMSCVFLPQYVQYRCQSVLGYQLFPQSDEKCSNTNIFMKQCLFVIQKSTAYAFRERLIRNFKREGKSCYGSIVGWSARRCMVISFFGQPLVNP